MSTATLNHTEVKFLEENKWHIAKFQKHGQGYAPGGMEELKTIIKYLGENGISLKPGKEIGYVKEDNEILIQPNKTNGKKIAAILERDFEVKRY